MAAYEDIIEVNRLKMLAETVGWKLYKEVYRDDYIEISLVRKCKAAVEVSPLSSS